MFNFKNLFRRKTTTDSEEFSDSPARRWFLKGSVIGMGAISAVAGLTGLAKSKNIDLKRVYREEVLPGDKILVKNGFEEVSKEETDEIIQQFVNDYKYKKLS
jgi:hypothetical protein